MDTLNAWIIANIDESLIDGDKLKSLPIGKDDLVVLMNTAVALPYLADKGRRYLYLRGTPGHCHYFGEDRLPDTNHMYEAIFYLEGDKDEDAEYVVSFYPKEKKPSTGFLTYLLYENICNVTLVNFIGPSRDKKQHWDCHDWEFEYEYYKNNNAKIELCLK